MLSFQPRVSTPLFLISCLIVSGACDDDTTPPRDAGGMDASGATGGTGGSGGAGGAGGDQDAMTTDLDSGAEDARVIGDASPGDANTFDANTVDAASCEPLIALHDSLVGAHVVSNVGVTYNSNPPSSGPHCGSWGQYTIYSDAKPLPRCNYIHNLEHGGVVLAYKCDGACPEIVEALTAIRNTIVDAQCPGEKRVIITPDPDLDTPIAAVAWRTTWQSDCVNQLALSSLAQFIRDNLGGAGLAPESSVCSNGSVGP